MNYKEKTFWGMQKDCILYAKQHESEWIQRTVIREIYIKLVENENELDKTVRSQGANDPGGSVAQKKQTVNMFVQDVYRLSRKICFYAKNVDNQVLLHIADHSLSDLDGIGEKELFTLSRNIIDQAQAYLPQTDDYGITQDEIDKLSVRLDELKNMPSQINMVTNDRKTATREIKDSIAEARVLLDKLDDAFEGLIDNQGFVDGWFAVRKIKGRQQPGKNGSNAEHAA